MLIRSRAPMRLGLAGGGTDLSPYCDQHGGAVLNVTIGQYVYTTLEPLTGDAVEFVSTDMGVSRAFPLAPALPVDHDLALHAGVYNRIVRDYCDGKPMPLRISTFSEAVPGSGLGSSSTVVVSMLKAYTEYLGLPLGDYDTGHLAFEIERIDLGLAGGRQDQYAATFGGFNFMEFYADDRVIVNPLRVKNWIMSELESSLVLFFTGKSRSSATIIQEQSKNISSGTGKSLEATHQLKRDAYAMKEAVLKGNIGNFTEILNRSWRAKRQTADSISNPMIDRVFEVAIQAGALGGKVSGAGGGGFIMFVVDPMRRSDVLSALAGCDGQAMNCHFTHRGMEGWRIG